MKSLRQQIFLNSSRNWDIVYLENELDQYRTMDFQSKFKQAQNQLDTISQARLVISSRLHTVLPAIALETPTIYVKDIDTRQQGLLDFVKYHYTPKQFANNPVKIIITCLQDKNWRPDEKINDLQRVFSIIMKEQVLSL